MMAPPRDEQQTVKFTDQFLGLAFLILQLFSFRPQDLPLDAIFVEAREQILGILRQFKFVLKEPNGINQSGASNW
jgi:hypothetical protein